MMIYLDEIMLCETNMQLVMQFYTLGNTKLLCDLPELEYKSTKKGYIYNTGNFILLYRY